MRNQGVRLHCLAIYSRMIRKGGYDCVFPIGRARRQLARRGESAPFVLPRITRLRTATARQAPMDANVETQNC